MKKISLIAAVVLLSSAAVAQLPVSDSNAPVEISAKHSLEWNRKQKTYTARENALAKQGAFQISSDLLTAHYTDDKNAGDISTLNADGHVVIQSPPYAAYGDNAVYTIADSSAQLTGGDLRIETPTERLSAKHKIEFFGLQNKMTAIGDAVAVRGTDTMRANVMTAYFYKAATGKLALQKITAEGSVSIRTLKETITGTRGIYDVVAGKATLTGKIRVLQGDNWLEGTRAVVDLKTGVSQLFAEGGDGRVKGLFYPKKKTQ